MANVIGSGSDTLAFQMSGDADGPSGVSSSYPEFTVNVDGQQIGGLQTVTASHAAGDDQSFAFQGDYAPGAHTVTVTFANNNGTPGDTSNVSDGGDRNVYVDSLAYDGQQVTSGTTPIYESPLYPPNNTDTVHPGDAVFTVNDTTSVPAGASSASATTPSAIDSGSGADTLTLNMAEDPYNGDAQFNVAVDGKQVGGTFTTTANQWEGQEQAFNLHGDWGSSAHTIGVTFLNDAHGPVDSQGMAYDNTDRNLYVHSASYDGVQASGAPWELDSDGTHNLSVAAGGQPGNVTTSGPGTTNTGTTTDQTGSTTGLTTTPTAGSGSDTTTTMGTPPSSNTGTASDSTTSSNTTTTTGTAPSSNTGTSSGSTIGNDTTTTTTGTVSSSNTGTPSDSTTSTGSGDDSNATITTGTLTSDGSPQSGGGTSSGMTFVPPATAADGTNGSSNSSSLDLSSGGGDSGWTGSLDPAVLTALQQPAGGVSDTSQSSGGGNLGAFSHHDGTGWSGVPHAAGAGTHHWQ